MPLSIMPSLALCQSARLQLAAWRSASAHYWLLRCADHADRPKAPRHSMLLQDEQVLLYALQWHFPFGNAHSTSRGEHHRRLTDG